MKTIIHRASERGHAHHGWLSTYHSFSFADWYDEKKVHFGKLRVLNDDTIGPDSGFGMHPHDNMEIVTILLKGVLEHQDSMGNKGQIRAGEVQAMSAGTGIMHSEYNPSKSEETKLFQIWVYPKEKDITPRYEQKSFQKEERDNKFQLIVSPEKHENTMWINQDAFFSLGNFEKGISENYSLKKKGNGVYLMVIEGKISVEGNALEKRDAIGISETDLIKIKADERSEILIIEVPMN